MKVKPLYDRVLVKRVEEKEQKRGGIIIPDTAKEKPMEGKVMAVGAGRVEKDGKRVPLRPRTAPAVPWSQPHRFSNNPTCRPRATGSDIDRKHN